MLRQVADALKATNLLTGVVDGVAVTILDYSFVVGHIEFSRGYHRTLMACRRAVRGVPDFLLYAKGWTDKLSGLLGSRPVEVPDEPEFNRRFVLRGAAADEAAACFTPKVVRLLLQEQGWTVEVQGGLLAVFRSNKTLPPDEYPRFVQRVLELAAALRRGAAPPDWTPSEDIQPADPDA
jgi:hypothetical protein